MSSRSGFRRAALGLGRTLLWIGALTLVAEGAYRGWLLTQGEVYSGGRALAELREHTGRMVFSTEGASAAAAPGPGVSDQGELRPHPFFGWQTVTELDQLETVSGYFQGPDAEQAFDVLLVGGSAAQAIESKGQGGLRRTLVDAPGIAGRKLRILYAGHKAFKQPQQTNLVTYLLGLGWKPDVVINIDGRNELALGELNHTHGIHPLNPWGELARRLDYSRGSDAHSVAHLMDQFGIREQTRERLALLESTGLHHSALLSAPIRGRCQQAFAEFALARIRFDEAAGDDPTLAVVGPAYPSRPRQRLDLIVEQWAECSRMLHAVCRAHAIEYLHVLAPPPPAPPELLARLPAGALAEFARAGARLAAEGIAFVDSSAVELSSQLATSEVDGDLRLPFEALSHPDARALGEHVAQAYLATRKPR